MGFKQWWNGEKEFDPLATPTKETVVAAPVYTPPPQQFGMSPILDQSQHEKWSKFFTDKLTEVEDPTYRQLQIMVDAMGQGVPAQTAYNTVFAGLKAGGVTKQALLNGAQKTLDALQANAKDYLSGKETQRQKEVQLLRDQALEKQQQIAKLQQEIASLNQDANANEAKINTNILGYNTYSAQALAKVGNNLQSITNFIPN